MTEAEVRGLCLKSRELFLQQPILLELEAPLKICGKYCDCDYEILNIFAMNTHYTSHVYDENIQKRVILFLFCIFVNSAKSFGFETLYSQLEI